MVSKISPNDSLNLDKEAEAQRAAACIDASDFTLN